MNKEHPTPSIASGNLTQKYSSNNQSFLNEFVNWFRDFTENAE